jgi:tetratricopeptide (TPR) repeat protein
VAAAAPSLLTSLLNKSLLRQSGARRYDLHELVRQFAAEKLDGQPQEQSETRDLYCGHYAEFLHQRAEDLIGERQKEALAEINVEIENVRAAWQHAVVHSQEIALEKSLVSLLRFYERRSWFQEGLAVFGKAAASLETSFGPIDQITGRQAILLGLLLSQQGWYSHRLGRSDEARAFLQKSVALLRRQGVRWELANVLNELGVVTYRSGDYHGAKQLYEESVAICRALDERRELSVALSNLGNVCRALGEYEQAKEFLRESVSVFKERGDHYSMAVALNNLGEVFRVLKELGPARQCYQQGLTVRREIGDRMGIAVSLTNLAGVAQVLGEHEEANRLAQESLTIFLELENRRESAYPLGILGCVARDQGDYAGALAYYGQALKRCLETKHTAKAVEVLVDVAGVLAQGKEKARAVELLTLIAHHPATQDQIRCDAASALANLETDLPPERVASARKRGQGRTLEDVAQEIMDGSSLMD